jgi:hypothetical protein
VANISVTDAAFTGFRVIRRNPGVLIAWALFHLITMAAFAWLIFAKFGDFAGHVQVQASASSSGFMMSPKALELMRPLLPLYAIILPISLLIGAMLVSAANRSVLRPRESGLGYLRLGMDEIRQLILVIAFVVLGLIFEVALGAVSIGVAAGAKALLAKAPSAPHYIPFVLGVAVFLIVLITVEVRLSLASAQTFATRKINLFGSWRLTAGQFWPMLATYVLMVVVLIVVAIVVAILVAALAMLAGGVFSLAALQAGMMHGGLMHGGMSHGEVMTSPAVRTLAQMHTLNWKAIAAVVTPYLVVQLIGNALLNALVLAIALTPAASIYRALTADTAARVATPLNMG